MFRLHFLKCMVRSRLFVRLFSRLNHRTLKFLLGFNLQSKNTNDAFSSVHIATANKNEHATTIKNKKKSEQNENQAKTKILTCWLQVNMCHRLSQHWGCFLFGFLFHFLSASLSLTCHSPVFLAIHFVLFCVVSFTTVCDSFCVHSHGIQVYLLALKGISE